MNFINEFKEKYFFLSKIIIILNVSLIFFIKINKLNYYNKFYVTLTSWKGRIKYIHKNLERLLNNTIKPQKLILNLSTEEFPQKNLELPPEIINLQKKFNFFEIFWVKENNNVFKKLIPTLNRFKRDLIISLDDDILYPNNLFEKMLNCYKKYGGNNPMSFSYGGNWKINGKIIHSHYGAGSIVSYKYFNNKINIIYKYTTKERLKKKLNVMTMCYIHIHHCLMDISIKNVKTIK